MKNWLFTTLRWTEKYTKTDMVYLVENTFWLNLNNVLSSIFALILSIVFARYVSKEVYGGYQFILSFASVLGTLTLTGMNASVTQAVARGIEGVFTKAVKTQLKFASIPFFAGIMASGYYFINNNYDISLSILIIAILLPIANALNTWSAFLNGRKDFKSFFFYSQITNVVFYIGMIFCIFLFPQTTFLIITNFILLTVSNLIIYFIVKTKSKPNTLEEDEAIEYGKKLSLSSILPLVSLQIDNIIIFHLLGARDLAIYAFASNIPDKFMSLLRPISTIAFPKFAQKKEEATLDLKGKLGRFLLGSILFSVVYIILAPFLYRLFFTAYIESIIYSQVYVIGAAVGTTASLAIVSIFASRSKNVYTYNIINPLFNIGVILLGAYTFGIWGVILGRILGNSFSLVSGYILGKD